MSIEQGKPVLMLSWAVRTPDDAVSQRPAVPSSASPAHPRPPATSASCLLGLKSDCRFLLLW